MFGISGIALIIIVVAIAVPSGGWWASSHNLRVCKAEHNQFVTGVESVGVVADLQGRLTNQKYETHKKESDYEMELARGSLLAFADSMRKSATNTRGSLLPTPAPSTGNPERTDYDRSYLTRTFDEYDAEMAGIEGEVTEQLIEGATAESGLNGAKRWAQGIEQQRNEEQ